MSRPSRIRRLALAGLALVLAGPEALALDWTRTEHAVRVAPLQDEVAVEFAFANAGARPVAITEIRTNCDCLEATADRMRIAPGERGLVRARFSVGERLGLHERAVLVFTDESADPVRLAVKVDVPAPAEVSPRTLEWLVNTDPASRAIELTVAPELTIDFASATSTGPGFDVRLEPIEAGKRYRVFVTPKDTARRASTAIRIRGKESGGRELVVSAYAYVR